MSGSKPIRSRPSSEHTAFEHDTTIDSDNEELLIIDRSPEHRPITTKHMVPPLSSAIVEHSQLSQNDNTTQSTVDDTKNDTDITIESYNNDNEPEQLLSKSIDTLPYTHSAHTQSSWWSTLFGNAGNNEPKKSTGRSWLVLGISTLLIVGVTYASYLFFHTPSHVSSGAFTNIVHKPSTLTQHARFRR